MKFKVLVALALCIPFVACSADVYPYAYRSTSEQDTCFSTAFSAGYVFKHDCAFKQVYGKGMINAITADACYYPWNSWAFGAKVSYWRSSGHTTFLCQRTLAQQVPVTLYVKKVKEFACRLRTYLSLGGGIAWIQEKSYLSCVSVHKGIAEVEVGLHYNLWNCLEIMGAVRYLFPRQSRCCVTVDVGGADLRTGLGVSF